MDEPGRRTTSRDDFGRFEPSNACNHFGVNDRLRRAIDEADVDVDDIARATGVNHRTVQRWIAGRVPHPRYRRAVARLVKTDAGDLWPGAVPPSAGTTTSEIVNVYSDRGGVPAELWRRLLQRGQEEVNLLGAALYYLFEDPGVVDLLMDLHCNVLIALADPASPAVAQRDEELRLGGTLGTRIEGSLRHLERVHHVKPLVDAHEFEIRLHSAPMYCSLFRVDDDMLVTPHLYGRLGRQRTPVVQLRRRERDGMFESYEKHFYDVFQAAVPHSPLREQLARMPATSAENGLTP